MHRDKIGEHEPGGFRQYLNEVVKRLEEADRHAIDIFKLEIKAIREQIAAAKAVTDAQMTHLNELRTEVITDREVLVRNKEFQARLSPIEKELSESRGKANQKSVDRAMTFSLVGILMGIAGTLLAVAGLIVAIFK